MLFSITRLCYRSTKRKQQKKKKLWNSEKNNILVEPTVQVHPQKTKRKLWKTKKCFPTKIDAVCIDTCQSKMLTKSLKIGAFHFYSNIVSFNFCSLAVNLSRLETEICQVLTLKLFQINEHANFGISKTKTKKLNMFLLFNRALTISMWF